MAKVGARCWRVQETGEETQLLRSWAQKDDLSAMVDVFIRV